jgi:hypothetical protein
VKASTAALCPVCHYVALGEGFASRGKLMQDNIRNEELMKMTVFKSYFKKNTLAIAIFAIGLVSRAQAADLDFSGFLSVGGGVVSDEVIDGKSIPYLGYSEKKLTFNNNLFGLQVTGKVSDDVTATGQLIAKDADGYQVNAKWAYLTWQVSDNSRFRVGRMRTPFYMYSDFLDVGYSYAWIAPPREVYYLPFNNINGVDFYTTATFGSFDTSLQTYVGGFDDEFDFKGIVAKSKTRNQAGLVGTIGQDWWTFRAAYHIADLSIDVSNARLSPTATIGDFAASLTTAGFAANADNLLIEDDHVSFAEVGLTIDTGRFVAAAEHVQFTPSDSLLGKAIRSYVMGGVRFGDWLIHVTASTSKDEASQPELGIPVSPATAVLIGTIQAIANDPSQTIDRDVITLGTRWDLTSGTALKFQIDSVKDQVGDQKVFSVAVQTVF